MATKIKICGISDSDILAQVSQVEVDFVGFVHHSTSPRHVDIPLLAELITATPEHINSVVVLVDPTDELLEVIFDTCTPGYLQLHGNETVERVEEIKNKYNTKIIKAIAVANKKDISRAGPYKGVADMLLFDTKSPTGASGGTGESFDWALLAGYSNNNSLWMLSGGLSSANIAEALRITQAPIIDASSYLETPIGSGKKDISKIKEFVSKIQIEK